MEIVTPSNRLMAQFTYTSEDTFIAKNIKDSTVLGTLEVAEAASQQCVLDQVVCTTVVLIERAKRRGQNLRKSDIMVPTTGLGATAIG